MPISYVNGDISTSDNVSTVTGVSWTGLGHAAGDQAFSIWALFFSSTGVVQDADLTTIDDHIDQNLRSILSRRTMTGSESGTVSYVVDAGSLNRMAVALAIYRGVDSIGTPVRVTEGGTGVDQHPFGGSYANQLTVTPTADNALILLVYSERSSTGNTAGTLTPPTHVGTGTPATIRRERGTGNSGGTYVCIAEFQLGAGTAGVAQVFTQWNATPDTLVASNADMWLVPLYPAASGTTVTPTAIGSGEAWGTPAATGSLSASLSGIGSAEAWGTPSIAATLLAAPAGIPSSEAWGTPTVAMVLAAAPAGIPSGEAWGTPSVGGALSVSPTGIPSGAAWGTPAASGSLSASLAGIASGEAWGTPVISAVLVISPTGIPSAAAFGTPTVTSSSGSSPTGIPSAEAWGLPTVSAVLTGVATGIASGEQWGTPAAQLSLLAVAVGIDTAEAWGSPVVTGAAPAPSRDLTLVGSIEAGRFRGTIEAGRYTGSIEPGRWTGDLEWP